MYYIGGYLWKGWHNVLLSEEKKKEIEKKAIEFLVKHNETQLPISPERLAKLEGLNVEYADMDNNCIGEWNKDEKKIIVDTQLKGNEPYARCVIAHELGHFVFGDNVGEKTTNGELSEMEAKCNYFAQVLLMPKPYVEEAVKIHNEKKNKPFDSIVEYIRLLFNVTERKARNRLGECGIVQR